MILKGSQRSGGAQLASHLLNDHDNDHVTVLEVRGFIADDLHGAFAETRAISKATKCKQYLFSLSLNPPKDANAREEDFIRAADEAEKRLGLEGQPRALVLHEKEGRRHAHVVWSRIDPEKIKAINLSHFKNKLTSLSKELYLEHGWNLPDGLRLNGGKSPMNFTLAEWQQAKRLGLDPREIKDAFRSAYNQSDNLKAFDAALQERGYFLARGDRRGVVAVDVQGEVYAVARYVGIKTGDLRKQMGDGEDLKPVDEVHVHVASLITHKLRGFIHQNREDQAADLKPLKARNDEMRREHSQQRERLRVMQEGRARVENDTRATRLRKGLFGLWDTVTGKAGAIRRQNELEAYEASRRDQKQRDGLVIEQMIERRSLQQSIDLMRRRHIGERRELHREVMTWLRETKRRNEIGNGQTLSDPPLPDARRKRGFSLDL